MPLDTCAILSQLCRPSQTPHLKISKIGELEHLADSPVYMSRETSQSRTGEADTTWVNASIALSSRRTLSHQPSFSSAPKLLQTCAATRGEPRHSKHLASHFLSKVMITVVVFHLSSCLSHLCYTPNITSQIQTRVKLNRVFFPRCLFRVARSPLSGFTSVYVGTVGISLIHSCASLIRRRGIWLP